MTYVLWALSNKTIRNHYHALHDVPSFLWSSLASFQLAIFVLQMQFCNFGQISPVTWFPATARCFLQKKKTKKPLIKSNHRYTSCLVSNQLVDLMKHLAAEELYEVGENQTRAYNTLAIKNKGKSNKVVTCGVYLPQLLPVRQKTLRSSSA